MLAKTPPVWNRVLNSETRRILENLLRQIQPKAVPAAPPPAPFSKKASPPQLIYGDPNKPLPLVPATQPADSQYDQHLRDRSSSPESEKTARSKSRSPPRSKSPRGKHRRGRIHKMIRILSLTSIYLMRRETPLLNQRRQENDQGQPTANRDVDVAEKQV